MRGILEKMFETGCMRAFITVSRRSAVTMSRRRESRVMLGSAAVACSTWLRVSTSSPTRFIMRLSRATSTRRVLSAALPTAWTRALTASAAGMGSGGGRELRRGCSGHRHGRDGRSGLHDRGRGHDGSRRPRHLELARTTRGAGLGVTGLQQSEPEPATLQAGRSARHRRLRLRCPRPRSS